MKIAYTYHGIVQKVGGVSRYFFEISSRLAISNSISFISLFTRNVYFRSHITSNSILNNKINFKGKSRLESLFQEFNTLLNIFVNNYDLVHHTGEKLGVFLFFRLKLPLVITVHDMTPEFFYTDNKMRISQRRNIIFKSNAIICVSENTKKDLLEIYPSIDSEKVFVIYHGCSIFNHNYTENSEKKYILYVGSRYHYKNFFLFVESISELLIEMDINLICTGDKFSSTELKHFEDLNISTRIINKGFVDETTLANLYHNALCFVYPSLYEGFGLPILESFLHHCPVCLSNTSCFPEVAKDAAIYFDPYSKLSIKSSIIKCIKSRDYLVEKGLSRLNDFSWNDAADKTFEVYKYALNNFRFNNI